MKHWILCHHSSVGWSWVVLYFQWLRSLKNITRLSMSQNPMDQCSRLEMHLLVTYCDVCSSDTGCKYIRVSFTESKSFLCLYYVIFNDSIVSFKMKFCFRNSDWCEVRGIVTMSTHSLVSHIILLSLPLTWLWIRFAVTHKRYWKNTEIQQERLQVSSLDSFVFTFSGPSC